MTLFAVRLGWWMGNPRYYWKWKSAGSTLGLAYLFSELLAQSDQQRGYVYLSDGGHFENRGVYELIKRRCRLIVACDADCDEQYGFEDLLSLIEKARADFDARIEIDFAQIRPEPGKRSSVANFAVGNIFYDPANPQDRATLIYIKASLPEREAVPAGAQLTTPPKADFPPTFGATPNNARISPIRPPLTNGSTNYSLKAIARWENTLVTWRRRRFGKKLKRSRRRPKLAIAEAKKNTNTPARNSFCQHLLSPFSADHPVCPNERACYGASSLSISRPSYRCIGDTPTWLPDGLRSRPV